MNKYIQIIIGFLLADIITGGFHWFDDNYLDYCTNIPFLKQIAKDNELHHYFPRSIIGYSYLENITLTLPSIIILLLIVYLIDKNLLYQYPYLFITFSLFSLTSNIIHKFSHMRDCEKSNILLYINKTGFLCSHKHHGEHHTNPSEKYCVISEYSNYILDYIGFWRGLEYIIYITTGIKPHTKQSYQDYNEIFTYLHENAKLECPDTPTKKDIKMLEENLRVYKKCV